jgi:hypothetical protein
MIRLTAILISAAGLAAVFYALIGKNKRSTSEITENEQKKRIKLIIGGLLIFLGGLITALYSGNKK